MGKNWGIAIGINHYENLPELKYAQRDAGVMRNYFLKEAEFEKVYYFSDNSLPITDAGKPFSSQPTYATLKRFLRVRFNQPFLESGDNLWFFFSGHGLRHADRDYLMPSDADPHPDGIEDTAIPINYITERLRRCGADNVVLLLDACRNEQRSKGLGIGEEKQQGVITIASCSPDERSYEIKQLQQGSFTYALLESLRIEGEGNCATVERLYQRLSYRVTEINKRYKIPRQTPYAITEPATKYHLILLPKQATLIDIATLREDAQDAELEGDLKLAEHLWTRVLAVSPADPKALSSLRRIWERSRQTVKSSPPKEDRFFGFKSLNSQSSNKPTTLNFVAIITCVGIFLVLGGVLTSMSLRYYLSTSTGDIPDSPNPTPTPREVTETKTPEESPISEDGQDFAHPSTKSIPSPFEFPLLTNPSDKVELKTSPALPPINPSDYEKRFELPTVNPSVPVSPSSPSSSSDSPAPPD